MMRRIKKYRDGLYYLQEKRAPGLAGGIWCKVSEGFVRKEDVVRINPSAEAV
jgi:hypothetical protein